VIEFCQSQKWKRKCFVSVIEVLVVAAVVVTVVVIVVDVTAIYCDL